MKYIFQGKNGLFEADIWENSVNAFVSVYNDKNNLEKKEVLKDDIGWFFFHEEQKFYVFDWVRLSIHETVEKLKTKPVTSDMLCQSILSEGVSNVKFLVPMKAAGNPMKILGKNRVKKMVVHIEERENRTVKQNFRVILVPDNPGKHNIEEDMSTEKLLQYIKKGTIKVLAA